MPEISGYPGNSLTWIIIYILKIHIHTLSLTLSSSLPPQPLFYLCPLPFGFLQLLLLSKISIHPNALTWTIFLPKPPPSFHKVTTRLTPCDQLSRNLNLSVNSPVALANKLRPSLTLEFYSYWWVLSKPVTRSSFFYDTFKKKDDQGHFIYIGKSIPLYDWSTKEAIPICGDPTQHTKTKTDTTSK